MYNFKDGARLVTSALLWDDHRNDAITWRKSTKEADKHKIFYCNLESKNL